MKLKLLLFTFLIINQLQAQTGCPGCIIELPNLPEDTIFLSNAPDGEVGVFYDGDLSFRLPKSTDPVPNTQGGLDISEIKILNIVNLPPGLSWEANQTTFDPDEMTDGCVKFCGTPLVSDTFEIGVIVEATVAILSQTASFTFDLYIAPASANNDGFSATNTQGCGELAVDFTNNIPSNGQDGFSYSWDFGNGNSSTDENPPSQIFTIPGLYPINYEAMIDTVGFVLTSIDILDIDCDDLIGDADIFIRVKNPAGETIFDTDPISDTPIPINIPINLNLNETGTYRLEVRDQDPLATADCGNILFDQNDNTILTNNDGLEVQFNILNPIFTVNSTDTIIVLEEPEEPMIMQSIPDPVCTGTTIELTTDYLENIQWFRDSTLLFGATDPNLLVNEPGVYWVQFTADNGCQVVSELTEIEYLPSPATPVHNNDENLLSLNDEVDLPLNFSAQWSFNGAEIPFADETFWCMKESGSYTLTITNEDNGCSSSFTFSYLFDANFPCDLTDSEEVFAEENIVKIYPNPSNGLFNLELNFADSELIEWQIFDGTGKAVFYQKEIITGDFATQIDLNHLESGVYWIQIITQNELISERIIIQ